MYEEAIDVTGLNKINLGCGTDIKKDYVNLEIRDLPGVDIVCDMTEGIPVADNTFDYALAKDLLEHFPLDYTDTIMQEWNRILKPGGHIEIMVPNTLLNINNWLNGNTKCRKEGESITERFSCIMFGGQDYSGNFHYQLFDKERLWDVVSRNGFKVVKDWHFGRGLCILGKKWTT